MAFVKESIVCVVFVAVVVKGFSRIYEENAADEDSGEEQTTVDVDRIEHDRSHDHAHSYHHFFGPVVGQHELIHWKDKHGHDHHDYKAYPKYKFSYGVYDHRTKDHHGQKEYRDGKHIEGEYHIHEPGGNIRSVKYHADPHGGFHAEVHNYGGNIHSDGSYSHFHKYR